MLVGCGLGKGLEMGLGRQVTVLTERGLEKGGKMSLWVRGLGGGRGVGSKGPGLGAETGLRGAGSRRRQILYQLSHQGSPRILE